MAQKLSALQKKIAEHYNAGEYDHIKTMEDAQHAGDSLFTFCINEAEDAERLDVLKRRIEIAMEDLQHLLHSL